MRGPRLGVTDEGKFERRFFGSGRPWTWIGEGSPGGKAGGLIAVSNILGAGLDPALDAALPVSIPTFTVIRSGVFDAFLAQNRLLDLALSDASDTEIAQGFLRASLPAELLGDLRAIVDEVRSPLAVRSSSLLEDALFEPFAGVYATKMIPNHHASPDERFRRLMEAIKLVYATVFFRSAKNYIRKVGRNVTDEKMAVMLQEIVGTKSADRHYPEVSGVARSYNYYAMGEMQPREGVVSLALGLGKTVVDGDPCWLYSPSHPAATPPVGSIGELIDRTQSEFWAVNMGKDPPYDPVNEAEYLVKLNIAEAEEDERLGLLASTYDVQSERLRPGTSSAGPRVLNFSGLLVDRELPLNDVIRRLLRSCEEFVGAPVEIEFALTLRPARFGFLQVRPMVVSEDMVEIVDGEFTGGEVLAASEAALGNGVDTTLRDVVYVRPDRFDLAQSRAIAADLEEINFKLMAEERPYILIGFGRWGSSDPWLGIPVTWDQVSGAKVIVESTHAHRSVDLSQGSHFFHNLISFRVLYFSLPASGGRTIDWGWLDRQRTVAETERVRHVRLVSPLTVKVDGRTKRGVIWRS
ncbi:MAG TPA: PEP/pyruvate-binding domain-containing protein [Bacteroidota bacterium]|nr:PEP/pyruvate-binding domain-containing protein [Bacteroidota bacterium]